MHLYSSSNPYTNHKLTGNTTAIQLRRLLSTTPIQIASLENIVCSIIVLTRKAGK